MKIMTWNIEDGGVINRYNPILSNIKNILNVIQIENPDILIIQEFQYTYKKNLIEDGLKQLGYSFFQYDKILEEYTLRYGVLIASKFKCVPIEKPQNILKYSWRNWNEILIPDCNLKILGIDVPLAETTDMNGTRKNNRREKKIFLDELNKKFVEYKNSNNLSLILGDFNLHDQAVFKEYLKDFSVYLTETTTKDATHRNHKFDYIFGNSAILNKSQEKSKPIWTEYSDHAYLFITVNI
ncbi:MAG: endonuclease/exonuclease/phosphatase family protein [Clostridium sp.]